MNLNGGGHPPATRRSTVLPTSARGASLAIMDRPDESHRTASALAGSERIGSALHALASDLIAERRRVARLERENKELRAQVEALQARLTPKAVAADPRHGPADAGR